MSIIIEICKYASGITIVVSLILAFFIKDKRILTALCVAPFVYFAALTAQYFLKKEVQPAVAPQPAVVIKDTVTVTLADSTALKYFYRREKRLNDQLGTAMALLRDYVEQENRLNAYVQELRDSLGEQRLMVAKLENTLQVIQDSLTVVTAAPAVVAEVPTDTTIALLKAKAAWLAAQPRRIYSVGAEDNTADVEVANAYRVGNDYLLVALATQSDITSVQLNGSEPIVSNGNVFVYPLPASRVFIEALIGSRRYAIRTSIKKLTP